MQWHLIYKLLPRISAVRLYKTEPARTEQMYRDYRWNKYFSLTNILLNCLMWQPARDYIGCHQRETLLHMVQSLL